MMAIQAQLYKDNYGSCLDSSQNWVANPFGIRDFCFQKQQHQSQIPQQQTQTVSFDNKNNRSIAFPQSIAASIEKQRQEVDRLISLQNERLGLVMQEQREQQVASILRKYEAKMEILMKQKDQEIAKAIKRNLELEELLRKSEIESQTWQRVAKENESMAESLNNRIEQLKENAHFLSGAEDAESLAV